jgi:ABC-2 type transport system ATP-binding protein
MQLLADDVVIIAAGQLIRQGTMAEVLASMSDAKHVRVRTPQADELAAAIAGDGVTVTPRDDGALLITGVDAPAVGKAALAAGVELHELAPERPDLEGVFLELTAGKAGIR